jgi:hypothetical protein
MPTPLPTGFGDASIGSIANLLIMAKTNKAISWEEVIVTMTSQRESDHSQRLHVSRPRKADHPALVEHFVLENSWQKC